MADMTISSASNEMAKQEVPILMSAPMVLASLRDENPKQQTRRPLYVRTKNINSARFHNHYPPPPPELRLNTAWTLSPWMNVKAGAKLWVRENGWERPERTPRMMREGADTWAPYYYDADGLSEQESADFKAWGFKRRPSIHMPRWACRLELETTADARVERLQNISEADAKAEGARFFPEIPMGWPMAPPSRWSMESPTNTDQCLTTPQMAFANFFNKLSGDGSWEANPWVVVISFRRIKP